jgi:hypothetical protein
LIVTGVFLTSCFFSRIIFPQAKDYPAAGFLQKFTKILAAQGAPLVSMTPGSKLTVSVVDTVSKFTDGVNDTCGHIFFSRFTLIAMTPRTKFATNV